MKRFVLALTGASGICYAKRLFDFLQPRAELHVVISDRGAELLSLELDLNRDYFEGEHSIVYKNNKMNAGIASGSFPLEGMVILPASMGTVGRMASGISSTLIERTAEVCLKENSKLVIVPRETPLNSIHLKNLLTLEEAGAVILPASPGFYHKPQTIYELVDFVVARILKHLNVEQDLIPSYDPNQI